MSRVALLDLLPLASLVDALIVVQEHHVDRRLRALEVFADLKAVHAVFGLQRLLNLELTTDVVYLTVVALGLAKALVSQFLLFHGLEDLILALEVELFEVVFDVKVGVLSRQPANLLDQIYFVIAQACAFYRILFVNVVQFKTFYGMLGKTFLDGVDPLVSEFSPHL